MRNHEAPTCDDFRDELADALLYHRCPACAKEFHLLRVDIDADNLMSPRGEAGS
jgi:hypothetical protein